MSLTRLTHKPHQFVAAALIAGVVMPAATASAQSPETGKPAAQIFTDSVTAMEHLPDFKVSGTVNDGTQTISVKLVMSTHGGGGSMSIGGATIHLVVTKKFFYMKASPQSWKNLAGGTAGTSNVFSLLAGKWVKFPIGNAAFSGLANFSFSNKFLPGILKQSMTFTKEGETTWDGRSAIALKDSQGADVYIAAKSPHYLLGVAKPTKGADNSDGSLKFSDFGTAAIPAVPVNAVSFPS